MTNRFVLATLAASLFTGCMVGPNYRRPAVTTPDVFRGSAETTPPADLTSLADLKWFDVFKDDRLQDMVRTALVQNYDLREAMARVDAARANLGITRADQFPTIDGSADVTATRFSSAGAFPLPQGFPQQRTFGSVAINLVSFEADIWGRLRRATEAARADLLASDDNRKAVITTVIADVAGAYFNLLELDMELEIARRTLAGREDSLQLIRAREAGWHRDASRGSGRRTVGVRGGAGDPRNRAADRANGERDQTAAWRAPGGIARGRSLLEQEEPPSVPPGLPSSLLERRPDIRAAEQNLVAANAIIGVAKAAYFPRISLTGFLGFQSTELSSLFSGSTNAWQFFPQVTQPIFNGGRIRSNVRLAEAEQQIALVQYERVIQNAFREVSDALIQYRQTREIRTQRELLVRRHSRTDRVWLTCDTAAESTRS